MNRLTNHLRRLLTPLLLAVGLASAPLLAQSGNQISLTPVGSISDGAGSKSALLKQPQSVALSTNGNARYAYVASYGNDALEIVNVTNPASPKHAGSISHGQGGALLGGPSDVAVNGNYAYVASLGSNALEIVDVTDPANPKHAGSITHGQGGAILDSPTAIKVARKANGRSYAYVVAMTTSRDYNVLSIVDVTAPTAPVFKGTFRYDTGTFGNKDTSLAVVGDLAYFANGYDEVVIVNVSNPELPRLTARISDPDYLFGASSISVVGIYAYVASPFNNCLTIVDVRRPDNPVIAGSTKMQGIEIDMPTYVEVVAGLNNVRYAYVLNALGVSIIDVSNPASPSLVGEAQSVLENPTSLKVFNGLAHIVDGSINALVMLKVRTPNLQDVSPNPTLLGSIYDGGEGAIIKDPTTLAVAGNYAYVANTGGPISIVNVGVPASPTQVGSIDDARLKHTTDIAIVDNYAYCAYIADWPYRGVSVVDVSNPANPVIKGSVQLPPPSLVQDINVDGRLAVAGNYVYLVGSKSITSINISNPAFPVVEGSLRDERLGFALGIKVTGNYAYVNTQVGSKGYVVVNLKDPKKIKIQSQIQDIMVWNPNTNSYELNPNTVESNQVNPFAFDQAGNYLYTTDFKNYAQEVLKIVDVSQPAYPARVGSVPLSADFCPNMLRVCDGYVYILGYDDKLDIFDVRNPRSPAIVGSISNGQNGVLLSGASNIVVVGDYVYVTTANGLRILKITRNASTSR